MTLKTYLGLTVFLILSMAGRALAVNPDWKHSGSITILTTPEGADLPDSASVEGYPLLVTLHKDFFDFRQAKLHGDDIRFSSSAGESLPFQIEEWDSIQGTASVWVRIPVLKGNSRQEIKLRWGNPDARSESSGKAVFNESNGYLSVWHMNDPARDEVGTIESSDAGTTATAGIIGRARHFPGQKGIFGGDKITTYPSGSASHSSEAWFRAETPNSTILGWGNEGSGRGSKVRMQLRSPPHVHVDSDFSDVNGEATLPLGEWTHVIHTYDRQQGKIYINGKLDGSAQPLLDIKRPARLWIGGWYDNYDFAGDIDEVRISKVARSADWIKLQYENLKPLQTLVGPLVRPGEAFSVSRAELTIDEGKTATISAEAGGAQKVYWIVKRDGRETIAATDRLAFTFDAGRVEANRSLSLQFKAIYPNGIKTRDIPITIAESIPEPIFTVQAPGSWDGRTPIEVLPHVLNQIEMQAKGAGDLSYHWSVDGLAAIKQITPGKLILKRSQGSGNLIVKVAIGNGGKATVHSVSIQVSEPKKDAWVKRVPEKDERPEQNQFYARDDHNEGTLFYNGTLPSAAETVFLKLYADDKLVGTTMQKPLADKSYAFSVKLVPGLVKYKVEFGTSTGTTESVIDTISNLVCGDAYLIDGQSNADATDVGKDDPTYASEWIRSYGSTAGHPEGARVKYWGNAVVRDRREGKAQVGYWGLELARRLLDAHKMPICLINGAVGGSRIDQHQRNDANPTDISTIYGRSLGRIQRAKLTHGIRGVLWHQGENDQGADGPTGRFGWESYQRYFIDLAAAWKQDYPNIQHLYMFQIWPKACSMGVDGSDNRLREVQRNLPTQFSNLSIMSTLGIKPPGGCHFPIEGYAEFARLIGPLVERDNYGKTFATSITPPNLVRAYYVSPANDEIRMEFNQPVKWENSLVSQFSIDGQQGKISSGSASGSSVTLKLASASTARRLTYLDSSSWSPDNLLKGDNGIAALTFCEVPILARGQ